MKKLLALLLACVMLLAFVACNEDNINPSGNESTPAATTAPQTTESQKNDDPATTTENQSGNPSASTGAWPTDAVNAFAAAYGATIPAFTGDGSFSFESITDSWKTVNVEGVDRNEIKAWMKQLSSAGFLQGLSGAFVVGDMKALNVSYTISEGEGFVSFTGRTLKEHEWPRYRLYAALGENFGYCVPALDFLGGDYSFNYDASTLTVTCANADEDLLNRVIDDFTTAFETYEDEEGYFVTKNFWYAPDEDATEGKMLKCYMTSSGSNLTLRFAVEDCAEED